MPRDPLGKLTPGETLEGIPAQTWNSFVDATKVVRRWQANRETAPLNTLPEIGLVNCKNASGVKQDRFNVMRITDMVFDPGDATAIHEFQNFPTLKVDKPDTSILSKYVILQEPIDNGKIGYGLIAGISPVLIDVKDTTDDYAEVINADATKLRSQPYGSAQILYKQAGTGTVWAYVVHGLPGSQFAIGKTAAAHAKGSTGTINLYRGTTKGSETYTSGDDLTNVYNRFATLLTGKWVLCVRVQGGWELVAAEC
jgi:hypothetical protein